MLISYIIIVIQLSRVWTVWLSAWFCHQTQKSHIVNNSLLVSWDSWCIIWQAYQWMSLWTKKWHLSMTTAYKATKIRHSRDSWKNRVVTVARANKTRQGKKNPKKCFFLFKLHNKPEAHQLRGSRARYHILWHGEHCVAQSCPLW